MRRRILGLTLIMALAIPAGVAAQACVGLPVGESLNAAALGLGFPENGMSYGASVQHNMAGPLTVGAGYTLSAYDNVDPKQHGLAANVGYDLADVVELPVQACPVAGLGYTRMSQDGVSLSTFSIPLGLAIGHTIAVSPNLSVIPHVAPQWVWTRFAIEAADGTSFDDSDSVLAARLGATFALERFFFGANMMWINEDGVDPVFGLIAGMPF